METNSQNYDISLYNQIEEAYGKIVYSYTTQIIHAGRLHKKYTILKWAQLILSALSTGGFISTLVTDKKVLTWLGAISSAVLLILTAYFKDSEMSSLHKKHLDVSNQLWLYREMYMSLLVDFSVLSREEIVSRRDKLQNQVAEVYKKAPITDKKSYSIAQNNLKENEAQFFTRPELNKMLPESLRKLSED